MNSNFKPEQIFNEVLNHVYQVSFKNNRAVHGFIRDIGYSHYTWQSLRYQLYPKKGKLKLFVELLTLYLNDHDFKK